MYDHRLSGDTSALARRAHFQSGLDCLRRLARVSWHRVAHSGFARIRAGQLLRKAKMEREISRLSDHYIICGAGRVGRSAARELARRLAPLLIIEQSETKAARFSGGWLIMIGEATQEQTLRDAHIERARGLAAATPTDATNLYIVLT